MARSWSLTELFRSPVLCLVLLFGLAAAPSAGADTRAWPGEFLRMGAGARAMGMGNAYTAVGGDVYSTYFNPAGLASMEGNELALSVHYLPFDRRFLHLAYGTRIGPDANFGISLIQAGTEEMVGRDLSGNPTGSLTDSRNAFALTFSKSAGKWFSFGINTKLALWKLGGENAKAFGFDIGALAHPTEHLALAFVLRDIRSRFTWTSGGWEQTIAGANGQSMEKEDKFPLYYTLGASWRALDERLLLSVTAEKVQDNPLGIDAGVSYDLNDRFTLRGGYYQYSSGDELELGSPTFGMSLGLTGRTRFDYAYMADNFGGDAVHAISFVMSGRD